MDHSVAAKAVAVAVDADLVIHTLPEDGCEADEPHTECERRAIFGHADVAHLEATGAGEGQAYDRNVVVTDRPVARLRAIVVGSTVFVVEVVGPQTSRTTQIFSRVLNTLDPEELG
jgi:hypothetical protein